MGRQRRDVDTAQYAGRLAVRIRELREAKRLTVSDFARKLGVSLSTAYAWEANTRDVMPNDLPRIAKVLGCKTVGDMMPPR